MGSASGWSDHWKMNILLQKAKDFGLIRQSWFSQYNHRANVVY